MPLLLWDASALTKRYLPETGSETVDALFAEVPTADMRATFLGYVETLAALVRERNRASISDSTFTAAVSLLQDEILDSPDFGLLDVDSAVTVAGIEYVLKHNLNASDAAILAAFLRYSEAQLPGAPPCLLIAADRRFVRAAQAEGLQTLNPELLSAVDVPIALGSSGR